jgi:CheY-like chemotaxis protein/glycine cleavage system H lipoate-binding protein
MRRLVEPERRADMKAMERRQIGRDMKASPARRRNRILVAEDEEDTLLGLKKTLTKRGYAVDVARDGLEAAQKVTSLPFDVVVSDLKMPRIDGMELLHMTKETDENIAFIVITGYGTVDSAVEAMRLGASDYINKPFSPSVLVAAVEKALKKEAGGPPPEKKPGISRITRNKAEHTWLSVQDDGTVLVGADEEFYEMAGEIVYCDLPFEYDTVVKGQTCVRMVNERKHMPKKFLSPLSGTVVKVNEKMLTQPWLAQKDACGDGWLFAVVPSKLEEELR